MVFTAQTVFDVQGFVGRIEQAYFYPGETLDIDSFLCGTPLRHPPVYGPSTADVVLRLLDRPCITVHFEGILASDIKVVSTDERG